MLSRERIIKLDILTSDDPPAKIMSVGGKQFSLQNSPTGRADSLLIIKGRKLPELGKNTEMKVIASMKNGERVSYPSYVTISTEGQLNIVMRTERAHVLMERRRYYRVEADINCIINSVITNGSKTVLETPTMAEIRDLNIGGIFLCVCNAEFKEGDRLMLTILLDSKTESKFIDITAEIIKVQSDAAGKIIGYGCRFTNLTPAIEETFAKYVFKVQLDNLKDEL